MITNEDDNFFSSVSGKCVEANVIQYLTLFYLVIGYFSIKKVKKNYESI